MPGNDRFLKRESCKIDDLYNLHLFSEASAQGCKVWVLQGSDRPRHEDEPWRRGPDVSGGGAGARVPGPQQLPGALQGEEGGGQLPGLRGHARVGPVLALIKSMVSSDISKTVPVPQIMFQETLRLLQTLSLETMQPECSLLQAMQFKV